MAKLFISYSHDSDDHARRVRQLAEGLRARPNLDVALDQFVSPHLKEEWSRWSERKLGEADRVLVVVTETYRRRFQREENPGEGCGATFEGKLIHDDLYRRSGFSSKYRVALFEETNMACIPMVLRGYDAFHLYTPSGKDRLMAWLDEEPYGIGAIIQDISWPQPVNFMWDMADRKEVTFHLEQALTGKSDERIVLLRAKSNAGKTRLAGELNAYARELGVARSLLDCKGCPALGELLDSMLLDLSCVCPKAKDVTDKQRTYAVITDFQQLTKPALVIIDTYEMASVDSQKWIESQLLPRVDRAPGLVIVISGQAVPNPKAFPWARLACSFELKPILDGADWHEYAQRRRISISLEEANLLAKVGDGQPGTIYPFLEKLSGEGRGEAGKAGR